MILGWILYSVLLAACAAAAAQALELVARRVGRPTRWVWAFALLASVGMSEVGRVTPLGILPYLLPRAESAPWLAAPAAAFFDAYNPLDRWNPLIASALWASSALVAACFAAACGCCGAAAPGMPASWTAMPCSSRNRTGRRCSGSGAVRSCCPAGP